MKPVGHSDATDIGARSQGDRASVKLVQIFIIWSHITDGEALTYLGMCIAAAEADGSHPLPTAIRRLLFRVTEPKTGGGEPPNVRTVHTYSLFAGATAEAIEGTADGSRLPYGGSRKYSSNTELDVLGSLRGQTRQNN
jgi:hypothetical protein